MGNNPSFFKDCGDDCPVEKVSWDDVQEFMKKLSRKEGKNYSLPTEAQWEYAARAGTTMLFSFGKCLFLVPKPRLGNALAGEAPASLDPEQTLNRTGCRPPVSLMSAD